MSTLPAEVGAVAFDAVYCVQPLQLFVDFWGYDFSQPKFVVVKWFADDYGLYLDLCSSLF